MKNIDMSFLYHDDFKEDFFWVFGNNKDIPLKKTICKKGTRNYSRFFYIIDGIFSIKQQNCSEIVAKKGDILYLPADCVYVSKWSGDNKGYYSICFSLSDYNGTPILFSDNICIINNDDSGTYLSWFKEINDMWLKGTAGCKLRCRAKFYDLLFLITNETLKEKHKSITKGILYLENHYLEDTSIDYIAKLCNISPSGFRRLFKEYSDLPPLQYRNMLRIKKAQNLLKSGEYSVYDAAMAVNIPDTYYFSRLFKKMTGKNPKDFKNI